MKTSPLEWRFDGHRRRTVTSKLTARERELLDPVMGLLEQNDEDEGGIELADVIDASGASVALLALWPVEAGTVIDVTSGEELASIYELYLDTRNDEALRGRLKAAFEATSIRFDDPPRVFTGGRDAPQKVSAPAAADPALLSEIAALRAELDASQGKRDLHDVMGRISAFTPRLFGEELRPYPMRRPFELTTAQRAWLELQLDHYDWRCDLGHHGLPFKLAQIEERAAGYTGSPLARMLGRKPPLPLDTTVMFEGNPHPLWALFSDAFVGLRPESAFLDAIAGQPLEVREGAWRQLARGEDQLAGLRPRDKKEYQRGWPDPKDVAVAVERFRSMMRALFDGLGDRAEQAALEVLAASSTRNVHEDALRIAALEGLARQAKTRGGVLDPKYDEMIPGLAREGGKALVPLLSLLPPERAGELTGLEYFLVQAFPSESGLRRVVTEMGRNVEWQFAKGDWAKLATKLAAKFPQVLPLMKETRPKMTRHPDGLDKAIEAAEKALAKTTKKRH